MKNKRIRIHIAAFLAVGFLTIITAVLAIPGASNLFAGMPVNSVAANIDALPASNSRPITIVPEDQTDFVNPAIPTRIVIPAIKVDAPVIPLGVTKTGIMDVPNNFVQTGWYKDGTVPGNTGSAVIDAHVDNGGFNPTISGVFKHLRDLRAGDDVFVVAKNGSQVHFKVKSSESYLYKDVPTDELFNQNDGEYLKLITCNGAWLPEKHTYAERLIVTAEVVE
jgi:LPXTG-site transpeptidase (sortase) family protein